MSTVPDNWIPRHRITVEEYYRMAETGVLAHDMSVELIAGEVIDMAPIGSRHAAIVDFLARLLNESVGDRAIVAVQRPIKLDQRSQPQPDLALLKPRADFYSKAHPSAVDALLLIEVSDTPLRFDREIKMPLYASHFVPEVWLIDVQGQQQWTLRNSNGQGYASIQRMGTLIELASITAVSIDLSGLSAL